MTKFQDLAHFFDSSTISCTVGPCTRASYVCIQYSKLLAHNMKQHIY